MAQERKRLLWIDGLRGLACLAIFAHHFAGCFYPVLLYGSGQGGVGPLGSALAQSPLAVLVNGNFWVCVFFVMAGFVAAWGRFGDQVPGEALFRLLPRQLLHRYLRLTPPVFVVSALVLLMLRLGLMTNLTFAQRYGLFWAANWYAEDIYTVRSLFMESFVRLCLVGSEKFVGVLWSVCYLFYGNCLAALLAELGKKRARLLFILCPLLFVLGLPLGLRWAMYGCFPLGVLLARLVWDGRFPSRPIPGALLILLGLLLGAYPTFFTPDNAYGLLNIPVLLTEPFAVWHVLGAGMLVTGLCLSPGLQGLLSRRAPQWMGKISFSLYLVHMPVLFSLGTGLFLLLDRPGLDSYPLLTALTLLGTLPAVLLLSALFRRFVELPCARAAKWLQAKVFRSA
jgi:peptidoglycan/LPS O-acetylase OafA/YrhL